MIFETVFQLVPYVIIIGLDFFLMYSLFKMNQRSSLGNEECSCFGKPYSTQEQFLRPPDRRTPQSSTSSSQLIITKNTAKKSLKRTNTISFHQGKNERPKGTHFQPIHHRLPSSSSAKELLGDAYLKTTGVDYYENVSQMSSEMHNQHPVSDIIFHQTASFKQQTHKGTTQTPTQNQRINSPQTPKNIGGSYLQPHFPNKTAAISPSQTTHFHSNQKKIESLNNQETQFTQETHKAQRSPTNISRSNDLNTPPTLQKFLHYPKPHNQRDALHTIPKLDHNDMSSVNSEPTDHCVLFSPIHEENFDFPQQKHPLQSSWDRERAELQFASPLLSWQMGGGGRNKGSSMKRMEDLVQICSQADSEQGSESDRESIVVGRLNEYASMMESKPESSSTIEHSIQNRLMGLNSTVVHGMGKQTRELFI